MDEEIPKAVHALVCTVLDELPPDASPDVIRQAIEEALAPIRSRMSELTVLGDETQKEVAFVLIEDSTPHILLYLEDSTPHALLYL